MIKKSGSKFVVTDKSGTKVLGTHPSKEKAAKQLAAIEISKAKHMKENTKRFKDFRNTLSESEYKETLTGYPNRGINTEDGPVNFRPERMAQINAMLNAISRSTFQSPNEAFIRIKTRLNLLMLDFPWTPYLWQDGGTGPVTLTVTLFGRVDGIDGNTGNVVMNGKANPTAGLQEFTLLASIEMAEDGLYRVTAKMAPKTEPVVAEEGVEHDGDSIDEMAQTPARQRDMEHAIQRHDVKAQRGYEAKMNKTGKAAERGRKLEDKHDTAVRRLIARDTKEYESEKLYGRGGKIVKGKRKPVKEAAELDEELTPARQAIIDREKEKASKALNKGKTAKERDRGYARGSRINYLELVHKYGRKSDKEGSPYQVNKRELNKWRKAEHGMREEVEQIEEMLKAGDRVKVPHKGKMVKGKIVRHDNGGSGKAQQHGGGYVVDVGEYGSITVPGHKVVKEQVVDEALIGGQKRLDVNKNKRLDAQDFTMLRNKKKAVKEDVTTEFTTGLPVMEPALGSNIADQSGKGTKRIKKTVKEAATKKPVKKPSPHTGAANVIGKQKAIKDMLNKHGMRW